MNNCITIKQIYLHKYVLLFVLILQSTVFFSQSKFEKFLVLNTIITDSENVLNHNTKFKLYSKVTQIATNYGYSAVDSDQNFIISIDFHLYDKTIITGLKRKVTINGELFFTVYNAISNIHYSSLTLNLSGYGDSLSLAINNAIRNLPTKSNEYKIFFSTAKQKIITFFNQNCQNIITEIDNIYNQHKYTEVIDQLSGIPMNSKCKNKVQELLKKSYLKLQDKNCNELLLKGKAEIATGNFKEALTTYSYIDPESDCFFNALKEISRIENKIDSEYLMEWNRKIDLYKDQKELEKYRLEVIKEIWKAYYADKSENTNLDLIIIK